MAIWHVVKHVMPTLHITYFFDPLCGWCYGAAPAVQKMAEHYPLTLVPTGVFFRSGRKLNADFARYAWSNDQRIERLTGQPFSLAYRQNILQKNGDFDSENCLLALTAVRQAAPERELNVLAALQTARYVAGRDNTNLHVIGEVLQEQGLGDLIPLLTAQSTRSALMERIANGQRLARQLGVQGVPHVVVQAADGSRPAKAVPGSVLMGATANVAGAIRRIYSE